MHPSFSCTSSLTRTTSCPQLLAKSPFHSIKKPDHVFKKCNSSYTMTSSGWGIVPVLNELESRHVGIPRIRQRHCINCHHLFIITTKNSQFCSLDCQSSHTCDTTLQLEIKEAVYSSSNGHMSEHEYDESSDL